MVEEENIRVQDRSAGNWIILMVSAHSQKSLAAAMKQETRGSGRFIVFVAKNLV